MSPHTFSGLNRMEYEQPFVLPISPAIVRRGRRSALFLPESGHAGSHFAEHSARVTKMLSLHSKHRPRNSEPRPRPIEARPTTKSTWRNVPSMCRDSMGQSRTARSIVRAGLRCFRKPPSVKRADKRRFRATRSGHFSIARGVPGAKTQTIMSTLQFFLTEEARKSNALGNRKAFRREAENGARDERAPLINLKSGGRIVAGR